jgi:hypothetical protein
MSNILRSKNITVKYVILLWCARAGPNKSKIKISKIQNSNKKKNNPLKLFLTLSLSPTGRGELVTGNLQLTTPKI